MSSPHPLPTAVTSHTLPSSESSNCVAIGQNSSAFSSEGKQIFIFLSLSIFFSFFFYFSLFLLPHLLQWWMDICQISKLSQPHSQLCDYRIQCKCKGWEPAAGPGGLFEVVPDNIQDLPVWGGIKFKPSLQLYRNQ